MSTVYKAPVHFCFLEQGQVDVFLVLQMVPERSGDLSRPRQPVAESESSLLSPKRAFPRGIGLKHRFILGYISF